MSPSGVEHFKYWKSAWFLPIVIAIVNLIPAILTARTWEYAAISLGICFGYGLGYFIDPDLDLVGTTSAEGRMLKIPILGWFLVAYWTIYGAAFRKHHRSFWTHSYIVSTAIRFIYLFWWAVFVPSMSILIGFGLIGTFVGLCISDGIHVWADNKFGGR